MNYLLQDSFLSFERRQKLVKEIMELKGPPKVTMPAKLIPGPFVEMSRWSKDWLSRLKGANEENQGDAVRSQSDGGSKV